MIVGEGKVILPPSPVPPLLPVCLNNSKMLHCAALSYISLNIFVGKLVPLTCLSLQILDKTQTGVFPIFKFLVNLLKRKIVITLKPDLVLT